VWPGSAIAEARPSLRTYTAVAIALAQFWLAATVAAAGLDRERVLALLAKHQVPGASIAVVQDSNIVWTSGYGLKEAGGPEQVTEDTLFQAASISKPVAALGALVLVHQGRLGLDEDVNAKLSSWRLPPNAFTRTRPVTMRLLLSHRAGVIVPGFPGYAAGAAVPTILEVLEGKPPANTPPIVVDTTPASVFRYSGGGFCLLQQLMTDVAAAPFEATMDALVLRPLGMSRSTYRQPLAEEKRGKAAIGHQSRGPIEGKWHTYPELAAAGLWTTAEDLAKFGVAVQRAWRGESGAILPRELAREMLTPQGTGTYGLGLIVRGTGEALSFMHNGVNAGFESRLVGFPVTGQGAVVMTNANGSMPLIEELLALLGAEYQWPQ
jgi:CubicO group peptidase (beta-lactamase class C family)